MGDSDMTKIYTIETEQDWYTVMRMLEAARINYTSDRDFKPDETFTIRLLEGRRNLGE